MLLLLWHLHYISHLISQSEITSSIYLSHQNYLTHLIVSPYFQAFLMSCLSTGTNTPIPSENFSAKFDHFSQRGNTFFKFWEPFLAFLINSERAMPQYWRFSPSRWKGNNLDNYEDPEVIADNCVQISGHLQPPLHLPHVRLQAGLPGLLALLDGGNPGLRPPPSLHQVRLPHTWDAGTDKRLRRPC